jgi:DNA-binding beta-propeller fold protein YncE
MHRWPFGELPELSCSLSAVTAHFCRAFRNWLMNSLQRKAIVCVVAAAAVATTAVAQVAGLSGTLVVTNKTPFTATIVDVASGRTLATLPTGNGPHEIVITRDGRTAVVTDYGAQIPGSTLTVIDIPDKRVVRTIALGAYRRPHGIVMLPGDSTVAVTSEVNRAVLIVHIASGAIVKSISTEQNGSHMVGVTADATRAWTGDIGSNTVTELDVPAGRAIRSITVPAQPEAVNVTPDGSEVWVGSNSTGVVSVVDVATGQVAPAAMGIGWPYRVLFSADASLVLTPDLRGEQLRFLDRRTRNELGRLSFPGAVPQGIALSADGRYAFLSLSATGKVAVIDVAQRKVVGELTVGDTPDGVVYTRRADR